jgi:hypothetical protein
MITLPPPFASTADVEAGLAALERHFHATADRRGVFVTAYLTITRAVMAQCAAGGFRDAAWVGRYLVAFGTRYRMALDAYLAGDRARAPKAWRLAFDAA